MVIAALAVASVFIGLRLTGTELNISSMMGTVMIVGNVTEVAIFYCSEFAVISRSLDALQKRASLLVAKDKTVGQRRW